MPVKRGHPPANNRFDKRVERPYARIAFKGDISIWCQHRPDDDPIWKVYQSGGGTWTQQNYPTEAAAREAAGIPALEEVA